VPFACRFEDTCPLYVLMYIPGRTDHCTVSTLKSVDITNIACGVEFTNDDVGQHRNITLRAILGDNFNSLSLNQEFAVFLQISAIAHTFMHGNLLEPVRVGAILLMLFGSQYFSAVYNVLTAFTLHPDFLSKELNTLFIGVLYTFKPLVLILFMIMC